MGGLIKAKKSKFDTSTNDNDNIRCAFIALGGKADLSGNVCCDKLKKLVHSFGLHLDAEAMLKQLDADKNGKVNFDEFAQLFAARKQNEMMTKEMMMIANEDDKF